MESSWDPGCPMWMGLLAQRGLLGSLVGLGGSRGIITGRVGLERPLLKSYRFLFGESVERKSLTEHQTYARDRQGNS